jgi:NitT/TauT family transport system permease protein
LALLRWIEKELRIGESLETVGQIVLSPLRWINNALRIREPIGLPSKIVLGVIPVALFLFLWWFLTNGEAEERIISPVILPSPVEVVLSFHSLWFEAELSRSVLASAVRVVGGFVAALVIAFPLGVLMGSFSKVKAMFDPIMVFGAYLPIPALVPLTMSLFGIGEMQKIMFLAVAFLVFLLPMFVQVFGDVDEVYLQTARTLGAGKWQLVRRVLLGISMPDLYDAMRMGFGIGWTYIILAEIVAADRGLGHIIIIAQRRGPREHIYLVLVVIVLLAYVTDKIWMWLGRLLFPYRKAR